jgi:cystathionine gamma-lyase
MAIDAGFKDETRLIHGGLGRPGPGEPLRPGPVFASNFGCPGDPNLVPFTYGRDHNPTWSAYETALAALEGGPTTVFASGMAAVAALLGTTLVPGDKVVLSGDGYYGVRHLFEEYFRGQGLDLFLQPTNAPDWGEAIAGAKLVWVETPSNPGLDVCDLDALARSIRATGGLLAVDNTTATVFGQKPLALGADFSVCSDTKATLGHSDLILGHVAVQDEDRAERLRRWRLHWGACAGPMEVWLAQRSLATLHLRFERQSRNAKEIAEFLSTRPEVHFLRYPGLPTDPAHEIARRQMREFGPIIGFELADQTAAETFLNRLELIAEATSFGGLHTTAERRARWGGDQVAPGFIRLSVGCEHVADLIADLERALG